MSQETQTKKGVIMTLLKIFFATRIWVVLTVLAGLSVMFWPTARVFSQGQEQTLLLLEIGILVVSTGFSIFSTYEVESKDAFVKDIIGDVLVWTITIMSLTYAVATGMIAYWLPLAMLGVSGFFAFFDFLFSLNGGASKLLEMDKTQISRGLWPCSKQKILPQRCGGI